MIHIIRTNASKKQVEEMLEELDTFIKLAVDIRPNQQNFSMTIQNPTIKQQVETIARQLLGGMNE